MYTFPCFRIKIKTSVALGTTDFIVRCESNYHMIVTTVAHDQMWIHLPYDCAYCGTQTRCESTYHMIVPTVAPWPDVNPLTI